MQRLYNSIPTALGVIGRDGRYLTVNTMYAAIYGTFPDAMVGRVVGELGSDAEPQWQGDLMRFDAGIGMIEREVSRAGGYYIQAVQPMQNAAGQVVGLTLALIDITARRQMEQALEKVSRHWQFRASHDHLTGLPNRRHIDQALLAESRRCARAGASLSVLMIDVDLFKKYNDHVGHQRGDACLRAIAAQLQAMVRRQGDVVGRYGGEEFIAILPNTAIGGAHGVAQDMLRAIQGLDIKHPASPYGCVTLSIGVASMNAAPMYSPGRVDELLGNADRALYAAKAAGRNTACGCPLPLAQSPRLWPDMAFAPCALPCGQ
ncbi:GGDEF domain-containing protein [Dyella halodurans]|uniref:diguanylate cyclase n=1 Tax=Dyella halodurans TaxID=1920171 RepID=A0ABV9BWP5_9GAMM|nr:sensor domain-containing diguanylate cyclase [Dyella halodurans]